MFQILAEISLFPMTQGYETLIHNFIWRLRRYPDIEVTPGQTSTLISGEYETVFRVLHAECKETLMGNDKAAFVIKVLNLV